MGFDSATVLRILENRQRQAAEAGDEVAAAAHALQHAAFDAAVRPAPRQQAHLIEQAITDQTAAQTEARHAMRLEDERPEDELTGSDALAALARAFGDWPF